MPVEVLEICLPICLVICGLPPGGGKNLAVPSRLRVSRLPSGTRRAGRVRPGCWLLVPHSPIHPLSPSQLRLLAGRPACPLGVVGLPARFGAVGRSCETPSLREQRLLSAVCLGCSRLFSPWLFLAPSPIHPLSRSRIRPWAARSPGFTVRPTGSGPCPETPGCWRPAIRGAWGSGAGGVPSRACRIPGG